MTVGELVEIDASRPAKGCGCCSGIVPTIRVHDTRHTCASLLAALDVHPRVAMRVLHHSQISMTMNVYTQIPSPETRKALDRLNSQLDGNG